MRRFAIVLVLWTPSLVAAQGACPTAPPPACPTSSTSGETADALYGAVVDASNRMAREWAEARARAAEASERGASRRRRGGYDYDEPLRATPIGEASAAFVDAAQRFVCRFPAHPDAVTARYRMGRVYYEANRFAEAAAIFRAIAMDHPGHELGEYAANLYLDSLNVMATRVPEPQAACIAALRASIDPLWDRFCDTPAQVERHGDVCQVLLQLRCDALRLDADALAEEMRHREAAEAYARLAREHRACGRVDEVLWSAAREYDRARLVTSAIEAWTALIELFPQSVLAVRARSALAARLHATARFREAADQYLEIARRHPAATRAECLDEDRQRGGCVTCSPRRCGRDALREAIALYAALGSRDEARRAIELYQRLYGRVREDAAEVALAWPRMLSDAEAWPEARAAWRGWVRSYAPRARPDHALAALVALGRAHAELGEHERAEEQYAAVIRRWDGGALLGSVEAASDEEREARVLAVREAVAEAMFRRTDRRARALSASARPTTDAMLDIERDLAAIDALVVPAWSIAAAARLARLELHVADSSMRDASRTRRASSPGEPSRGGAGSPGHARALEHAERCARIAIEARWPSDDARACMDLLSRLAGSRSPPPDELLPALIVPVGGVPPSPVRADAAPGAAS